ncbi:MAG: glycerol-3-phosphate acyltransferase, partial [Vicinamibacterales bacterium]
MTPTLVLVGYLLGSIPFALLLGGAELRRVGSGNLGAANVLRLRRTSIALTVLVLDVAKGGAAVLLASGVDAGATTTAAVGGGAILGHVYPIWLRFKGGK